MNHPEVIAHRGMPRRAPENTLASFSAALAAGAHGIELDVHATADGVVVVHHDPWIRSSECDSDSPGTAIASLRTEELLALDAGRDVPSLDEVLTLVGDRADVYVEIKAPRIETFVIAEIRRHRTRCAVHSFDHRAAQRVRQLAPELPAGILLTSYLIDPVAALRASGARDLWQHWAMIDEPLVRRVHDAGARIVAWTVNAPDAIDRLTEMGVDALCSDVPDEVRQRLAERTLA